MPVKVDQKYSVFGLGRCSLFAPLVLDVAYGCVWSAYTALYSINTSSNFNHNTGRSILLHIWQKSPFKIKKNRMMLKQFTTVGTSEHTRQLVWNYNAS